MTIPQLTEKMIAFSKGDIHDIDHFMKVWGYAKTIGELEGLDEGTQFILELAALTHDIACPLCRRLYGNTNARAQEREGMILAAEFLKDAGLTKAELERVIQILSRRTVIHRAKLSCGLIELKALVLKLDRYGKCRVIAFFNNSDKCVLASDS